MKQIIKNMFFDIIFLYKNFIHWNFSKIIIYIYWFIISVLLVLPLILIYFVISLIVWEPFLLFLSGLFTGVFSPGMWLIFHIITFIFFSLFFILSTNFLLINLNLNYIEWKKLWFKNNLYLDYKLFFKFFVYSLLFLLILLVPIILFFVSLFLLLFLFWGLDQVLAVVSSWPTNLFSILSLLLAVVFLLIVFYIGYRIIFGFFSLLDKKKQTVIWALKYSFEHTKWVKKLFASMLVFLLFGLFYMPFNYLSLTINWEYWDLQNYAAYQNSSKEDKAALLSSREYYYQWLQVEFWNLSQENFNSLQNNYYCLSLVFSIIEFLLIYGFISMLLSSIYVRIIKQKKFKI